ncbi:chemotaxis protein CheB [Duganella violaceipulchra]|uniref:Chemotaxis protein CheB n=1 Tax=Duganella violaceipulchra TaxID=2849652 RepID=A0AA41HGJ5_9BURK|nr:chemotaxis protein CheB [Duganella violaceicalia]MBV6323348.1 chemotaxis protein CheB [Duganella violaceicalia]MCP2007701.1 two-component system chemotaxis response regulator CheB [Duganella violaceicalia]
MPKRAPYRAIVLGVSAGGVGALKTLLATLPADLPWPLLIVQHISADSDGSLARVLEQGCALRVKEAEERERIEPGTVYLAPANYHLMVERDGTLALSTDAAVSYARPSIDVLFESAARAFGPALIGVILTGANADGSLGLRAIKDKGGLAVVQDPADAASPSMPLAALAAVRADYVVPLAGLGALFQSLAGAHGRKGKHSGR